MHGRTKTEGENALRADVLLVHTSFVCNAGGTYFARTMLLLMAERDTWGVVVDQIGSPIWAPGLAPALWGLIAKEGSGTFHHSDAGVASWYDFAVAIQDNALAAGLLAHAITIYPLTTSDYPTTARRPAFSLLDCIATRSLLDDGHTHLRVNLRRKLEREKMRG
ncbi:sugar nucleotide-binding protein [Altererythrobacter sp. KTW20L]|nr:sugar nucleotide-binding protein [Altererythrobacter sp. KTW20L]